MKRTGLCPDSIFLLPAPPAISSHSSSSRSLLRLPHPSCVRFLSPGVGSFSPNPNPNLDGDALSYLRKACSDGGVFTTVGDALSCFGKMMKADPLPPSSDFGILLGAVVRMKQTSTAIRLIKLLHSLGMEDGQVLLTIFLNCFCRLKRVDLGLSIVGRMLKRGFHINVVGWNTLIDGLFMNGRTDEALSFLDDMHRKGPQPDERTYAIIVKGLCKEGNIILAIELLRDWEERGCMLNHFTYEIIIDSLRKKGLITEALTLHSSLSEKGIRPSVVTYNSLIHGLDPRSVQCRPNERCSHNVERDDEQRHSTRHNHL